LKANDTASDEVDNSAVQSTEVASDGEGKAE